MGARWYKRCGADFIHGTMMLTLEEKGAYSLCLDLIYDRGGPIPDDARWLSGVCGVSMRKWTALRERLVSLGKLVAEGGHLSNARAALELVSSELQARNQAEAGAKGGRKRVENAFDYNLISDLAQATLKPIEKIRREEKGSVARATGTDAPPDPVKVMFDSGIRVLGSAGTSERQARTLIGKWRQSQGTEAVIAALGRAQREGAVDPVAFIEGGWRSRQRDDATVLHC